MFEPKKPSSIERKREQRRRSYWKNRDEILSRQKAKYINDSEFSNKIKEYAKNYLKDDPDRLRTQKLEEKRRNAFRYSLYWRWKNMMKRCFDHKDKDYKNYGARGILVSSPLTEFKEYKKYICTLDLPDGFNLEYNKYHLDRIDNEKGYEIGNIRWIDVRGNLENSRNPKNNPDLKRRKS